MANGKRLGALLSLTTIVVAMFCVLAPAAMASPESDLVAMLNRERTSRGLHPLSVASDLVAAARKHSARMASQRRVYHNPNLGSEVRNWESVGENVGSGKTARRVHDGFMASSIHRENMLHRHDNRVGVGVVVRDGVLYVTQIFVQRETVKLAPAFTARRSTSSSSAASPVVRVTPARERAPEPESRTVEVLVRLASL